MKDPKEIRIEDYNYHLPDERIARYPADKRDNSKLLVYHRRNIFHTSFSGIVSLLPEDSILVYNETRVIRARLLFKKPTGAIIEIFCLEPEKPSSYDKAFSSANEVIWRCLIGNNRKWKDDDLVQELRIGKVTTRLKAHRIEARGSEWLVKLSWDKPELCFSEVLEAAGRVPVPPYLNRNDEEIDKSRYQTVYSSINGSVAAPTAGLHFTQCILDRIRMRGIRTEGITLHVGAGTFVPVKSELIGDHPMHIEHFEAGIQLIDSLRTNKALPVGTTSMRSLESLYWLGVKVIRKQIENPENIYLEQWYPYDNDSSISISEALKALRDFLTGQERERLRARTGIIIVPGYRFRVCRGLITNYHMPGSTLLLLVAALTGNDWRSIYEYALENDFRFLSYGDSSLLIP